MTIAETLASKRLSVSFEIFPPKRDTGLKGVFETAQELGGLRPDWISVTYGAGGTTASNSMEVAAKVSSCRTSALAHLTCVGNTSESIERAIGEFRANGVENVLALRGDIPPGASAQSVLQEGLRHANELVAPLKRAGFCVGAACYPEGHPESQCRERDIDNLIRKVDAGADFLVTQMFFDNALLYAYLYRLQSRGVRVPVVAGLMPITNAAQVARMVKLSGACVPAKLLAICDRFAGQPEAMRQAGIAYTTDQIVDLVANGVRGIHLYTMNKPAVARDVLRNVDSLVAAVNAGF